MFFISVNVLRNATGGEAGIASGVKYNRGTIIFLCIEALLPQTQSLVDAEHRLPCARSFCEPLAKAHWFCEAFTKAHWHCVRFLWKNNFEQMVRCRVL